MEENAGAYEGQQLGCVQLAPGALGSEQQFERHREPRRARACPLGDTLAQLDGREGGLDRVRRSQVFPVLGRQIVEREQLLRLAFKRRDGLWILGSVLSD